MGGILMQHHQISPNLVRKAGFPIRDHVVLLGAPRRGSARCSSSLNGAPPPGTVVKKHSKEELIAFFRDIQAAIARDSPKASRRTRKPSPADVFEDAGEESYEELHRDGQPNLEGMKVAELRELMKARGMKGYSKLKKAELIDRLKGGLVS